MVTRLVTRHDGFPGDPRPAATNDELEHRGFIEHYWSGLLGWLVVRQGLTRRIYDGSMGQLMLACLSRSLRTPQGARRKQRWFQIRSMNDPGCVWHPSKLSGQSQGTDASRRSSSNMAVTCV